MEAKVEQGNEDGECVIQWCSFKWLNLPAEEEVRHVGVWGRAFQAECQAPEVKLCLLRVARNSKEVKMAGAERRGKESLWAQPCHWAAHPVGIVHVLGEGVSHWQHLRRWVLWFHWYPNSIIWVAVLRIEWGCKGGKGETSKKALAKILKRNDCGSDEDGCNTVYEKWSNARSVYDIKQ